ncbi:hypothetical protein B0T18DRAFT_19590 [Schizothecium vesticola]|uniref:Uncharacterized protein n=1 Tax=Schizothecium vesticola TaxID=314040 RepID=A0AA40F9K7_9PEZI|nr:hypothetical protein B0T18DRAFT_19590 [Schizothecium vesticola]
MMACVSGSGSGIDEIKKARPFCQPQRKKSWESCLTAGSSNRQPSHISPQKEGGRMFCSETSGRVYLAARSGDRSSTQPTPPGAGPFPLVVVHTRPGFGRIVSNGGMVPSRGPIKIHADRPLTSSRFPPLWPATVPLVISMCGSWRRMEFAAGVARREARMGSPKGSDEGTEGTERTEGSWCHSTWAADYCHGCSEGRNISI